MIRIASAADLRHILPMVRAYHEFEDIHLTERQRELAVRALLGDPSLGGIWLVIHDRAPVGYIALCFGYSIELAGRDATVDEFFIAPEHRGHGLGTLVLERIKKEAEKYGVKALHLEVSRTNARVRRLYSRANFEAREKFMLMSFVPGA